MCIYMLIHVNENCKKMPKFCAFLHMRIYILTQIAVGGHFASVQFVIRNSIIQAMYKHLKVIEPQN